MSRFVLVFKEDDVASAMGSAWVGVDYQVGGPENKPVVTHDCGTPGELEATIEGLKRELDHILAKAKVKFAANMKRKTALHAVRD